jgi:hypothetical protein
MESSKFKTEKRNKLYFNKFQYKANVKIVGVQYTYYTTDIDIYKNRIEKFKSSSAAQNYKKLFNDEYYDDDYWNSINFDSIEKYLVYRDTMPKSKFVTRISGDTISVFSNDLSMFNYLYSIDPYLQITQAHVLEMGKMYFKRKPKYKYRTYFKSRRMPKDFTENVLSLKNTYSSLHFCPALLRALFYKTPYNPYRYMHGSFYVEYNDESMLSILGMWFSNMLSKTYTCEQEP